MVTGWVNAQLDSKINYEQPNEKITSQFSRKEKASLLEKVKY